MTTDKAKDIQKILNDYDLLSLALDKVSKNPRILLMFCNLDATEPEQIYMKAINVGIAYILEKHARLIKEEMEEEKVNLMKRLNEL